MLETSNNLDTIYILVIKLSFEQSAENPLNLIRVLRDLRNRRFLLFFVFYLTEKNDKI